MLKGMGVPGVPGVAMNACSAIQRCFMFLLLARWAIFLLVLGGLVMPCGAGTDLTIPVAGSGSLGSGSMDLANGTLTVNGTYDAGSGTLSGVGNLIIGSTGTLTAGSSSITVTGGWTNNGQFLAGTGTVRFTGTASNPVVVSGSTVFNNLILSGGPGTIYTLPPGLTVNGTVTLSAGVQLQSSTGQPIVITLGPNAQVVNGGAVAGNSNVYLGSLPVVPGVPLLTPGGLALLIGVLCASAFVLRGRRAGQAGNGPACGK